MSHPNVPDPNNPGTPPGSQDPNNPDPAGQGGGTPPPNDQGQQQDPPDDDRDKPNPLLAELQTKYAQTQQALTEAQTKVKELERAKLDENDRLKAELTDAQEQLQEAQKALQDRAIENSFLISNKYTWHNPTTALRLLNRDGLKVAEDGSVSGIDAAIEALSKSEPYLIKAENNGHGTGSGPKGQTGNQPGGGGGGGSKDQVDRRKLEAKYPAIRR
jgi:hypothetical protein